MAKSGIPSKKKRQAELKKKKQQRNNLYIFVGLATVVLIGAAIFLTRPKPIDTAVFGELVGVQMDGSAEAPIQIIEYGDFGCHACRGWHNAHIKDQLKAQFGDQIAFSFRHFPVITPYSPKAAEAGQCAADQGRFWQYHDYIYESTPEGALQVNQLKQYAEVIALDSEKFAQCLDGGKYTQYVQDDLKAAQKAGARGTPTFLINGQQVSARPEAMTTVIQSLLDG